MKELLEKYWNELEHYKNGGKLAGRRWVIDPNDGDSSFTIWYEIDSCSTWMMEDLLTNPQDRLELIINDEYFIYRKALIEGKIIQFLQGMKNNTEWIDADESYFNGCGTNYLRIKPEEEVIEVKEPEIEIGDFVTFLDISNPNPKRVIDIKNDIAYTENNKCLISQCKLWKPTENDLVWKRNSKWSNKEESILSNWTEKTEEIYDLVEPYIEGKLPSWINNG